MSVAAPKNLHLSLSVLVCLSKPVFLSLILSFSISPISNISKCKCRAESSEEGCCKNKGNVWGFSVCTVLQSQSINSVTHLFGVSQFVQFCKVSQSTQ